MLTVKAKHATMLLMVSEVDGLSDGLEELEDEEEEMPKHPPAHPSVVMVRDLHTYTCQGFGMRWGMGALSCCACLFVYFNFFFLRVSCFYPISAMCIDSPCWCLSHWRKQDKGVSRRLLHQHCLSVFGSCTVDRFAQRGLLCDSRAGFHINHQQAECSLARAPAVWNSSFLSLQTYRERRGSFAVVHQSL